MTVVNIEMSVKSAPLSKWRLFVRELHVLLNRTLKTAAKDTAVAIKAQMRGVRHSAAMGVFGPEEAGGVITVGIGSISQLNDLTKMKPKYRNRWKYGYWFNVEFGREPVENRPNGPWTVQENPAKLMPLAIYGEVVPGGYTRTDAPGIPKAVPSQGMYGSRSIRRGLQLQLNALDTIMRGEITALMTKHGLVLRGD